MYAYMYYTWIAHMAQFWVYIKIIIQIPEPNNFIFIYFRIVAHYHASEKKIH